MTGFTQLNALVQEAAGEVVREALGSDSEVSGLMAIGSLAYPEFLRPDSDIDLVAVVSSAREFDGGILVTTTKPDTLPMRVIELRVFGQKDLTSYAFGCDITRQFGFVRGYLILQDTSDESLHRISGMIVSRYFSEAFSFYSELASANKIDTIDGIRYNLRDSLSSLRAEQVRLQPNLWQIRKSEISKQFIRYIWLMHLFDEAKVLRLTSVDPESPLLRDIGLFRVFSSPNGGRILDRKKYPKTAGSQAAIDQASRLYEANTEHELRKIMMDSFDEITSTALLPELTELSMVVSNP